MLQKLFIGGSLLASILIAQQNKSQCCGIVGILTKIPSEEQQKQNEKNKEKKYTAEEYLCEGIELLKNRGYDSAGIAMLSNQLGKQNRLVKYADEDNHQLNCIERVVQEVMGEIGVSNIGIAHTRWATCGERVSRNAHPHFDQNHGLYLVHNGILCNHAEIKNKYLSDVKFTSQTDTQVIVQYLALQKRCGLSLSQALRQFEAIAAQKSQWGLVIIDKQEPQTIYTSTNGSPLLIGFSAEENDIYVASETIAFQKHANYFFETKDHEIHQLKIADISRLKVKLESQNRLKKVDNSIKTLSQPPEPYQRFYNYEIRQQGEIQFHPDFSRIKVIHFGDYLSMIACGSSYYAAGACQYFFKKLKCFKKLQIFDPVELDHGDITNGETVVLISQSGQTKDLIDIVQGCKKKEGVHTIGIINVEGSTLARKVDFPIYIKVGREVCVAATKSFFHQVLNIIQFATEVAEQKKSAPQGILQEIRNELLNVPSLVKQTIDINAIRVKELASIIEKKKSLFLLGKRQTIAIAKECALKIKQLTYIHAEALGACEMKHGPIAMIESDKKLETVIFLFILDNQTYPQMMNALDQMHSRNAFVVIITNCLKKVQQNYKAELLKKSDAERKYHFALEVPYLNHLSHLLSIVPVQILVEQICLLKKLNPDMPRNLAKTVTV